MTANIIHDNRTIGKYPSLIEELIRQGIGKYLIWEAVINKKTVVESINASFKMIVRQAKKSEWKEVLIFEDDIMFPAEDGFKYFLANKPESFDVYIGGTYFLDKPDEWRPPVVKVNEWVGNHCIIIHEKYYDKFLELPDDKHIDTVNSGKGDFYVCFPFAALQRPGFSRNNMAICNYNSQLNENYIHQ